MILRMVCIAFLFGFLVMPLNAAEHAIDLGLFVEWAIEKDPRLEQYLHERLRVNFLKDTVLPSSAVVLSVRNDFGFALDEGNRSTFLEAAASKPFPKMGTNLSASYQINQRPDRHERVTTFGLEQSLLKNSFGGQVRRLDTRLDLENEVLLLQSAEAYEDYLAVLINNFLEWRLTFLSRIAERELHEESLRLKKNAEGRRRRNIATTIDVEKMTLQTLDQEETILDLDLRLAKQSGLVAESIGLDAAKGAVPGAVPKLYVDTNNFDQEMTLALEQSRTLRALKLSEDAGRLNVSVRKEELWPELNFVLGFEYDDSTRFTTATNRQELFVGFNFQWPLGQRPAKARVAESKYELVLAEVARRQYQQNLTAALHAQFSQLKTAQQRATLSKRKWDLAKRIVRGETKRYENGRIGIETLILVRKDLAENHLAYLRNEIELNKLMIEWFRLTDQLVKRLNPGRT